MRSHAYLSLDLSTGSWVALIAFAGLVVGAYLVNETENSSPMESLGAIILLIGAGCSVVMVFQGFHLWNSGWEGMQVDPETAGSVAAKGRGRGGIILLILLFFPQFLVFGYGGLIWEVRDFIRYSAKALGLKS